MPQNENVPEAWRKALGEEWERVHGQYLHRLGNLTLTAYNSEFSDRPFAEKRDMTGGFKESPLRVNKGLGQLEQWDESTIVQRATQLAEQCRMVWPSPSLDEDTLAALTAKPASSQPAYTLEDHPHVATGSMKHLFQVFRQAVLGLDPCVTEQFLKLYIAYKAETNFVDLVPQASRLLLSINIPYPELDDPKGLARDVTGMGRWGNGDTELGISTESEIPYAMGLIRQAFERQLEGFQEAGDGQSPTNGKSNRIRTTNSQEYGPEELTRASEYRAFFESVQRQFLDLCPEAKPGTVSGKHYHQIPTGISGLHYEWGFHGRPRDTLGIELHFESRAPGLNQSRMNYLQGRASEWRDELPEGVELIYLPDWGSTGWARMFFVRPGTDLSPELATKAAEDMAALYRSTSKHLPALAGN